MEYNTIIVEKNSGVANIQFNRPEALNALSAEMRLELTSAIIDIRDDKDIRAVILTGKGRVFCSGGDIKGMSSPTSIPTLYDRRERQKNAHRFIVELINLEKPVIAAVHGHAAGAGMSLVLAADIVIADETAKFVVSFGQIALVPDMACSFMLPRIVGLNKAKEMVFTGDTYDAQSAERLGIVNHVVPADELVAKAWQMAQRLAQGPTRTIGLAKAMLNKSFETDLLTFLETEACFQALAITSEDFKEGVQAFKEKRTTKFTGN